MANKKFMYACGIVAAILLSAYVIVSLNNPPRDVTANPSSVVMPKAMTTPADEIRLDDLVTQQK